MPTYRVYVRGHGGGEGKPLQPSEELPIDLITVGQMGSTMSDEVADAYIYGHVGLPQIARQIEDQVIIYWTKAERDEWYEDHTLHFSQPPLGITPYSTVTQNLALDGDRTIGDCGVCYWNAARAELEWIIRLGHKETILLSEILEVLKKYLDGRNSIELYWTACMSADHWYGKDKKVSFNPTTK